MKSGRRGKYSSDIPAKVKTWCEEGKTEKEICKKLNVGHSAFGEWKNKYPELMDALKQGKKKPDDEVENSLFKRATGYEYEEVTTSVQSKGGEQYTEVKKVKKSIPPDTLACIYWLKNRRPDKWKDKQEIDHKISEITTVEFVVKKDG